MTALLQIKNLTVTFLTAPGMVRAADDVTFDLEEGETLALVGETGSGKSVVAHAILNLLPENALATGTVWYRNRNLLEMKEKDLSKIRGREISLIIQNPALALNPVYSVGHQMVESLRLHRGMKKSEAARRARDLLQKLRFKGPEIAMRMYPFQMS
ncbi:MAG: ATP-binding cassette domain-containing protein, partial [Candidatus Aminicenantales bacterium]